MLEVRDAVVRFGAVEVLHGASLAVAPGQLVALVGPNGAGKSTLARAAAGLQPLTSGSVSWGGTDIGAINRRALARQRAFIPQRITVPAGVRVADAVALGRAPHLSPLSGPRAHDREAVAGAMARARVSDLSDRLLTTLSGGELQRVQLAVALAQEAPALLADEPTAHLDLGAAALLAQLLRALADDGLAVVLVIHDLALAAAVADEVVVLSQGRTVARGSGAEVLRPELLHDVWGVDASLESARAGRTALHVSWLKEPSA